MPAYVIFGLRATHDEAALKRYREIAVPTIVAQGGRPLIARGRQKALEGSVPPETVVVEFPDFASAEAWYQSETYQSALKLRLGAADIDAWIVDGIAPRPPV